MSTATEVMTVDIAISSNGKPSKAGLSDLADLLDLNWLPIGSGIYVPPGKEHTHGSIIFFLRQCNKKK